jgi:hypothetical protein
MPRSKSMDSIRLKAGLSETVMIDEKLNAKVEYKCNKKNAEEEYVTVTGEKLALPFIV